MTTALGAGGATVYAGMLLAAENAGSALAGARKATSNGAAGTNTAAVANAVVGSSPIAELPRASFIHRKDGTALFYKDWGTGTPVVFLHGAGLNSNMWMYQMVPLTAQGMRCVAYDRRGHGRSSDPGRGYDFDTLADDLAAVLEALNLRNVTLVGHSMASGEIVRYLTRHGSSRVSRVAMLGPTTPFLMKTADNPEGYDRAAFEALRALWLKDFPKWLKDNSPPFFMPETSPRGATEHQGAGAGHSRHQGCVRAHRPHRAAHGEAHPGCSAEGVRRRPSRALRDAHGAGQPGFAGVYSRLKCNPGRPPARQSLRRGVGAADWRIVRRSLARSRRGA
jgi:pimeloyl-ACP methyl ester carboxylesterase